ncbi:bis(5'-nucleosyl)-tetraphosphatase (symmetrical) YqeK [Paenibacillus sp. P26]|nr:bis(5'-nucleosyl)-tetraphosphatase (symmetrical) YqeK [Paenibacillus sp. P26]
MIYSEYTEGMTFSGDLESDVGHFLRHHKEHETYEHTACVVREAVRIAERFDADPTLAAQAALLHDISNVIPKSNMLSTAISSSIALLEEEYRYEHIVHQKLSKDMAHQIFGRRDQAVLSAIECHTTLKAGACLLDKVLFVADKISWDPPGEHPYQDHMRAELEMLDLNGAVLVYLNHVWSQRGKLKLVHPWLIAAREELLKEETGDADAAR